MLRLNNNSNNHNCCNSSASTTQLQQLCYHKKFLCLLSDMLSEEAWDALTSRLERLADRVQRHEERLGRLDVCQEGLGDLSCSLRECLEAEGHLRGEAVLARSHRRRFERTRARYPSSWHTTVQQVAETREHVFTIAEMSGRQSMLSLASCSRALASGVLAVATDLAVTLPPHVYVIGGEDDDGNALADVERLDPSAGFWEPVPSLGVPRKWCGATAFAGHIYVLGGWGIDDDTLESVDRFDPWRDCWEEMPSMLRRRGAVSAVSFGSSIWAVGGQDGSVVHDSVEALDVARGVWELQPPMLQRRHAAGAAQLDGWIYVVGGNGARGEALCSVERLDPTSGFAWTEVAPLREPRAGLAVSALGDYIYVVGGRDRRGQELSSVERLDPSVNLWEVLAPLAVARWGLGAVSCCDRLLALGGSSCTDDASIGACERYWPQSNDDSVHPPQRSSSTWSVESFPTLYGSEIEGNWSFISCIRIPRRLFGAASSR
ncbi:unnamed protein product [Polarella glacialis]|uniref:Uncharacterized protein n=1 Tax=Polarella glacialis TaxID=89957 RepID=A0A813J0V0_POLGL|nr:unnamed protein product [Polarella glacialis]